MQFTRSAKAALVAAALLTITPSAAMAVGDVDGASENRTTRTADRDDNDFPWGLLGLLGLAGLLGLRRKERDIHVDARRNH